jgi:hypothetical protein
MRRALADRLVLLPRGWAVLALALASWGLLVLAIQIGLTLIRFVAAVL